MGVDTHYYVSQSSMSLETLLTAVLRAAGQPVDVAGKPNVYQVTQYIRVPGARRDGELTSLGFYALETHIPERRFLCWVHTDHDSPIGPAWMLSGRSRPDVIALFRTVAERLGGVLVWQDSDDQGQLYRGPDSPSLQGWWALAHETPIAWVIAEDINHAGYKDKTSTSYWSDRLAGKEVTFMNDQRRKTIEATKAALEILQQQIADLRDEEQEGFDNLSEGLQQSERGQAIQAASDALGEASDKLEEAVESLEEASV